MNPKMKHDYQCNAAMSLIKRNQLEDSNGVKIKNPREVAKCILDNVPRLVLYTITHF